MIETSEISKNNETALNEGDTKCFHTKSDLALEFKDIILPFEIDGEYFVEDIVEYPQKHYYNVCKRLFDIVFSIIGLVVMLLPMLIIAVIIKLDSPGPVLYFQDRVGINGKNFTIVKFRSMVENAEQNGVQWSAGESDTRITKFGSFLRRSRIDEIPQLVCILRGDMSFVGPRPERKEFYDIFESYIHGFSQRLMVMPGLTGYAQINGGYYLRPEEKILYDVEYIKKRSILFDIKIILKTVLIVFRGDRVK